MSLASSLTGTGSLSTINVTQPTKNGVENQIHLVILSSFLCANILMAWILIIYNQHRLHNKEGNIVLLLQAHTFKILPASNILIIVPVIVRLAAGPMSRTVAEAIVMIMDVMVCLVVILTLARSTIKLLLVTNFGLVFSQDFHKLAQVIVVVSTIVAILPNLVFTIWLLLTHEQCRNITVAFLVGSPSKQFSINFATIFMLMWLLLSLVMVALVVVGIPSYLKRIHSSLAIRDGRNLCIFFLKLYCNSMSNKSN